MRAYPGGLKKIELLYSTYHVGYAVGLCKVEDEWKSHNNLALYTYDTHWHWKCIGYTHTFRA